MSLPGLQAAHSTLASELNKQNPVSKTAGLFFCLQFLRSLMYTVTDHTVCHIILYKSN